jgi:hypothetical protein
MDSFFMGLMKVISIPFCSYSVISDSIAIPVTPMIRLGYPNPRIALEASVPFYKRKKENQIKK